MKNTRITMLICGVLFLLVGAGCKSTGVPGAAAEPKMAGPDTSSQSSTSEEPSANESSASLEKRGEVQIVDERDLPRVVMKTDKGSFMLELYEDNAPNTVANFVYLVESGHYKGSDFHRVKPAGGGGIFNIAQGGRKNGSENFEWTIKNEAVTKGYGSLGNRAGTIAMARTAALDTAGCQFYINIDNHPFLDSKGSPYCVFGKVIEGLDVVDSLRKGDAILDAWVVQKRAHDYIPVVKKSGRNNYGPVK